MADLLINGMGLPKSCEDCFACYECSCESFDYCNILKDTTTRGERRKDCPLVEVKPHGRLIDADELEKAAEKMVICDSYEHTIAHEMTKGLLKIAPTVLEANNE